MVNVFVIGRWQVVISFHALNIVQEAMLLIKGIGEIAVVYIRPTVWPGKTNGLNED